MDLKKVFGTLLTLIGTAGLIYAAVIFVNETGDIRALAVYGVLGIIFFFSGISLIRSSSR